ncbi:MAG: YggS family pyridoxal phosphate-dependent enzyme [Chloroflexi bacterium]|nr:YggS family pyridoxal phosphate-dependent enzyme [Chloroflexota bacterium]
MEPDLELEALRRAREAVLGRIADACMRGGRPPDSVTLVAVSKTVPAERLRAAVEAGLTLLGENRVQEAEAKRPLVPGAGWHLVGPLQSNKARRALETFDLIQSVDSVDLARRLDAIVGADGRPPYPVLLQLNVDRDPGKAGFVPEQLTAAVDALDGLHHLEFRGLMTIGRLVESAEAARPTFVGLRELSRALRAVWPRLGPELSMGMSEDYAVAVEEGATIVRVGRALFGSRPTP